MGFYDEHGRRAPWAPRIGEMRLPDPPPHHRYLDCASIAQGDTWDPPDEDDEGSAITCPACRRDMGLP